MSFQLIDTTFRSSQLGVKQRCPFTLSRKPISLASPPTTPHSVNFNLPAQKGLISTSKLLSKPPHYGNIMAMQADFSTAMSRQCDCYYSMKSGLSLQHGTRTTTVATHTHTHKNKNWKLKQDNNLVISLPSDTGNWCEHYREGSQIKDGEKRKENGPMKGLGQTPLKERMVFHPTPFLHQIIHALPRLPLCMQQINKSPPQAIGQGIPAIQIGLSASNYSQ